MKKLLVGLKIIKSIGFRIEKQKFENISKLLGFLREEKLYPEIHKAETSAGEPEVSIDGKKYLMFCSNNYLGLGGRPEVINKASKALEAHGIGPGTSRLLSGNLDLHEELEKEVADLVGKEACITFPTGFSTNIGLFPALLDSFIENYPYKDGEWIVFSDEDNHASIVDGIRASKAKREIFRHNDIKDLEEKLLKYAIGAKKIIVTEGTFSLEGILAPLPEIAKLAEKYNAIILIDDAHGVGVLGKRGGGTAEHFGLQDEIDMIMGSFSKALGGLGGFVAGSKDIVDYLRINVRPYMYSSPIPGVITAGLLEAVKICKNEPELRKKLWENYKYLKENLEKRGFHVMGDGTDPVLPIMIKDENKAVELSKKLFEKGIYIQAFRWPAVPEGTARLRIVVMSTHKKEHLDKLIESLGEVGKEIKII